MYKSLASSIARMRNQEIIMLVLKRVTNFPSILLKPNVSLLYLQKYGVITGADLEK